MAALASVAWIVTIALGLAMFRRWLTPEGTFPDRRSTLLPRSLVNGHSGAAIVGSIVWILYLALDEGEVAWSSLALAVISSSLGVPMVIRWLHERRDADNGEIRDPFRPSVVWAHGMAAVVTMVFIGSVAITA